MVPSSPVTTTLSTTEFASPVLSHVPLSARYTLSFPSNPRCLFERVRVPTHFDPSPLIPIFILLMPIICTSPCISVLLPATSVPSLFMLIFNVLPAYASPSKALSA